MNRLFLGNYLFINGYAKTRGTFGEGRGWKEEFLTRAARFGHGEVKIKCFLCIMHNL